MAVVVGGVYVSVCVYICKPLCSCKTTKNLCRKCGKDAGLHL